MAEFEFFAAQMLSSWRSSVRAISLTIMAKYGKDDFVALVALDAIHATFMVAKPEAKRLKEEVVHDLMFLWHPLVFQCLGAPNYPR